jgi:hypothetical protein
MFDDVELLTRVYELFNRRDIERVLTGMRFSASGLPVIPYKGVIVDGIPDPRNASITRAHRDELRVS